MDTINNIPEEFICPITLEIMVDPVLCEDGHTYERKSIERLTNSISPLTRQPIDKRKLIPNRALKECIQRFIEPLNKEIRERDRLEKEKLEKEKKEREILERERFEKDRIERKKLDRERIEQERVEKERLEKEKRERERVEKERLEKERIEREKLEKERVERERVERERLDRERRERESIERERLEQEQHEKERLRKIEAEFKELKIKQLIEKSSLEYEQQKKESMNKAKIDDKINDDHILSIQKKTLNIRDNKIKYSYYINNSYIELIKVFGSSSKDYIENNIFNKIFDFIDNNNKDTIYVLYRSLKELCIEFNIEKTKNTLVIMDINSDFIDIFDTRMNLIIINEIIKLINHIVKIF
jgi:hypothetical protein